MGPNRRRIGFCLPAILFFCTTASAAVFISDGPLGSTFSPGTGRSLLQAQSRCPLDFERMNYTIFTSLCKGPDYPLDPCCEAFRTFACPLLAELNNGINVCAATMNSYINQKGNYTSGVFARCTDLKVGISCPAVPAAPPSSSGSDTSGAAGATAVPVLGASAAWVILGRLLLSI